MPQYPAGSFESAVGGFMQGYGTVRGMRRENAEDARRAREAEQAERMRQIQMENEGYKVEAVPASPEPRRNFMQSIGHTLRGRPQPEQETRMVRAGPSAAERAAEQARVARAAELQAEHARTLEVEGFRVRSQAERDAANRTFEAQQGDLNRANNRLVEGFRVRSQAERDAANRTFEAQQGDLNRANNRVVTGIQAGASLRNDARERAAAEIQARERFLDDLAYASEGNGTAMFQKVLRNPGLMAQAKRFGLGSHEYTAAAQRFRDRPRFRGGSGAPVFSGAAQADGSNVAGAGKGEPSDAVVDAALRQFNGDEARAAAHLRAQGYR